MYAAKFVLRYLINSSHIYVKHISIIGYFTMLRGTLIILHIFAIQ